jgi:hypothetical protein
VLAEQMQAPQTFGILMRGVSRVRVSRLRLGASGKAIGGRCRAANLSESQMPCALIYPEGHSVGCAQYEYYGFNIRILVIVIQRTMWLATYLIKETLNNFQ